MLAGDVYKLALRILLMYEYMVLDIIILACEESVAVFQSANADNDAFIASPARV